MTDDLDITQDEYYRDRDESQDIDGSVLAGTLAAIVESSSDAIIGKTLDGTITSWNAAAEALYGYSKAEAIGASIAIIIPSDHRGQLTDILERLKKGQRIERMKVTRRRKDGKQLHVSVCISPILDSRGKVVGASSIAHDVTERMRMERERAALLAQVQVASERQRLLLKEILFNVTEGRLSLCEIRDELPSKLNLVCEPVELNAQSLRNLRKLAQEAGTRQGLSQERWEDMVTAVGEAAMNAVVHAGGGMATICAGDGVVQVWIEDRGPGIEMDNLPRATLGRGYTTSGTLGHGFWIITKLADHTWITTGPNGTVVVIQQESSKPEPTWMRNPGFSLYLNGENSDKVAS